MKIRRYAKWGLAAAGMGMSCVALAQPVRGCPEGQAVQSLHPNGTPVQCVPVPAPVDIAPLMQAIVQESAERKQADAEIRQSINEASIVGQYAFTGSQTCMNSTFGFDESLRPRASTDPSLAAVVNIPSTYTSGFRRFNEDGTGEAEFTSQNVVSPSVFVTSTGFAGVGTTGTGPGARPSGNISVATQAGTFTWEQREGKLVITDGPAVGLFTGGPNVGCTVRTENSPPMAGVLAKDRKMISIVNEGVAVESLTITCPGAAPSTTVRICHRQRLLQKM
jgi:hypothetical protein